MPFAIYSGCISSLCRNRPWRRFLFASLASVIALVFLGCEKHEPARSEQRAVEVTVVTVTPRDVPVTFEFIAQVQSSRQVNIQARVSGFLDKRVYTEGSVVKEGQTLFLMDQKPFKAQLDQAQAALARHEAALEVARLNLARVKPLTAANALSQKDLDDAIGQFQSGSATVEEAKASVEVAKLNLSYTVITSPVTGISSYAQQADGTYLNPSNSLLTTVAVISPTYINFSISENDWLKYRGQIAKGLLIEPKEKTVLAEVVLADGTVYPHTGEVTFADPSYNAKTGTFLIRATVENPNGVLRPNQYVRVRLKGVVRHNGILVPQRAVQQSSKGHVVWVVGQENKAEPRPVVVGEWHENDWFIYEGLQEGDEVVVDGVLMVRPGAPLKVVPLSDKTKPDGGGTAASDPVKSGSQKGTGKQ
jgi:membrane fusion protein, multidrug efflux system